MRELVCCVERLLGAPAIETGWGRDQSLAKTENSLVRSAARITGALEVDPADAAHFRQPVRDATIARSTSRRAEAGTSLYTRFVTIGFRWLSQRKNWLNRGDAKARN